MRLSKSEKLLVLLLIVVVLVGGYYYLVYLPNDEKVEDIESDMIQQELMKNNMMMKIQSQANGAGELKQLDANIKVLAQQFYGALAQEDAYLLTQSFAKDLDLNLTHLKFNSYRSEVGENHGVEMSFEGDYYAVLKYIDNVQAHPKKVKVTKIDINQENEDRVSGVCHLEFSTFDLVNNYTEYQGDLFSKAYDKGQFVYGPFVPFDDFEPVVEKPVVDVVIPEPEEIDYETYKPKSLVYDFEDGSSYFVGNAPEMNGNIVRNKNSVVGGYSEEMTFDFVNARAYSEANLIFDNTPIFINKQADTIALWVHAFEASNHNIGLVLVDAAGKDYKILLSKGVEFTQWEELEVELPVSMTYPVMVQRIYVEGVGYEQKLSGRYLFDTLQVTYPVD